jgi:hypothetical protein
MTRVTLGKLLVASLITTTLNVALYADNSRSARDEQDSDDNAFLETGPLYSIMKKQVDEGHAGTGFINRSGPHLNYYGGPVISKVKVVVVIYGTGTYLTGITNPTAPSIASFLTQVTKSAYFTWLTEYNTPTQTIGTGSYSESVQITPAAARNGSTITDAQIQAELSSQMTAGHIPAPDNNTIYMVFFPKNKKITEGGSTSCVAGGFCAYHGTFKRNGQYVFYGVLPDMSPGTLCNTGCGGSSQFNNQTSVLSHELVEAVTDAGVGLAIVYGPPLAWYDPNNGEIGDICNGIQGTVLGSDNITYTVQKEWSNQSNACIVHK